MAIAVAQFAPLPPGLRLYDVEEIVSPERTMCSTSKNSTFGMRRGEAAKHASEAGTLKLRQLSIDIVSHHRY